MIVIKITGNAFSNYNQYHCQELNSTLNITMMSKSELFYLGGKTVTVTGGALGIGKACCEMLAQFGAKVVVSDYDLKAAEATSESINEKGVTSIAIDCNVLDDSALVKLVDSTVKYFGSL